MCIHSSHMQGCDITLGGEGMCFGSFVHSIPSPLEVLQHIPVPLLGQNLGAVMQVGQVTLGQVTLGLCIPVLVSPLLK